MLCGTPVVCSDLPGVRVAIQTTGMGRVVPAGDASALAAAILDVCDHRAHYVKPRAFIAQHYSTERTVRDYLQLYDLLTQRRTPPFTPSQAAK
jgi:glycosyltransferase involved in cell wall biosynthesis